MTQNAHQHDLPLGWDRAAIGEVATTIRGVSYKKPDASFEAGPGTVPVLRATNIDGDLNFDGLVYVPGHYVKPEQYLLPGDIVIAASSGSRSVVGKAAQLRANWTGSFGAFCLALRPHDSFSDGYLAWFLQSQEYRNRVSELAAGVNINNLRREHIEDTPVPVPPVSEQQRIVAEIEKQFTRLDASVAALRRTQANLKRYRASILRAACSGELAPTEAELARAEGREYEPAGVLLERILAERRAHWESQEKRRGKYQEPAAPDTSDLPPLPEGWAWATVDQIAGVRSGQTPKGITDVTQESGSGSAWYRVSDMNTEGNEVEMVVASTIIPDPEVRRLGLHLRPAGTIIFPKRGGAIATNKKRRLSISAAYDLNVMGMIPAPGIEGFVWWWFHTINLAQIGDGSNVPQINHDDIELLPVSLPPLAEQQRIVAEVERRLSVIQQAEAAVEAGLQRAGRLRQSILKRAFSGQLVPQDPDDQPASALLERIRAQREAEPAASDTRKRPTQRRRTKIAAQQVNVAEASA